MLFFGGLLENNNSNFQNAYVQIMKVLFFLELYVALNHCQILWVFDFLVYIVAIGSAQWRQWSFIYIFKNSLYFLLKRNYNVI